MAFSRNKGTIVREHPKRVVFYEIRGINVRRHYCDDMGSVHIIEPPFHHMAIKK